MQYTTLVMKTYRHPEIKSVTLADIMQALSDPCRIKIVRHLLSEPERAFACNEIPLKVNKATRSHHFDILRASGLAKSTVQGTKCLTVLRYAEIEKKFPGLWNLVKKA